MQLTARTLGLLLLTAPLLAAASYAPLFGWLALIWFVLVAALLLADWRLTPRAAAWTLARSHDDRLSLATQNRIQISVRLRPGWTPTPGLVA